ncbi:hypothetical protein BLOT_007013 [Blomia tropicalis]|nr:hypothetical protein BLOT_007013 [Blomia tropicalis]
MNGRNHVDNSFVHQYFELDDQLLLILDLNARENRTILDFKHLLDDVLKLLLILDLNAMENRTIFLDDVLKLLLILDLNAMENRTIFLDDVLKLGLDLIIKQLN